MAKSKSKTQKGKKTNKTNKNAKIKKEILEQQIKNKSPKSKTTKKTTKDKTITKSQQKKSQKNPQVVEAKDVIYNVAIKKEQENINKKPQQQNIKYIGLKEYIALMIKKIKINKLKKKPKIELTEKEKKELEKAKRKQAYKEKLILNQQLEKEVTKIEKDYSKYPLAIRIFVKIYRNLHIVFNSAILITFIILILGLFKIEVYKASTIIYFGSLLLFLIIVAISQNRYLSGKIFTTILIVAMSFVINKTQYTYDFLSILNSSKYEYKTYYVVAIDNSQNRSIHNINNKKVGVAKEISEKTSRVINTKISNVTYLAYENQENMFEDFYNQKFRAIVVNDNQYKYLENNPKNNKKIKKLYEFKAVTKK